MASAAGSQIVCCQSEIRSHVDRYHMIDFQVLGVDDPFVEAVFAERMSL